ncbi:Uu.00g033120.m01.CDS01 [Anthostomella pinea]|uniref:Uu.00g033120.m01.CDS01 n=1 Tax=Anthostomella pinea TaxID=933095 RepID=A0AAI8YAU3_9PEZI|nr:Uu.00g033120.m01.CDS01 [Anthostomella pinea]
MKETSSDKAPYIDRIRSWARSHAYGGTKPPTGSNSNPVLPISNPPSKEASQLQRPSSNNALRSKGRSSDPSLDNAAKFRSDSDNADKSAAPASEADGTGTVVDQVGKDKKPNIVVRFFTTFKMVLLHSWINVFLVFVPVGIVVANIPGINPGAVFGINAVAIIPLAALLSHATESVARKMGDTIGALLNVTFGNAVELIIFIALVKGEIRIVQASLLGSILANLLLILGMAFFLGGLRFREQIYNSTVTQMSACLLSLSVISLVLPTAFHASFADEAKADAESLKISRGTSVILLLVYGVYLLFQLKSHAYMYESTPQHIIDEESTPGPASAWLDTSSSESSSSSDSDSDASDRSRNTMSKRVRRAIRARRRRKSSVASVDTDEAGSRTRASSFNTNNTSPLHEGSKSTESANKIGFFPASNSQGSEEAIEEEEPKSPKPHRKRHKQSKRKHRRHRKTSTPLEPEESMPTAAGENIAGLIPGAVQITNPTDGEPRRVDFADNVINVDGTVDSMPAGAKRPFNNFRGISFRPVAKSLAPPVFTQPSQAGTAPVVPVGPVPRVRYGIRRTNSLPERLNEVQYRPPGGLMPSRVPSAALAEGAAEDGEVHPDDLSRPAAIIMLLISTALVAVCAEFMVDAINDVVETSGLKEIFIGLIILPIVGNAAEHVTAVSVAMKNKMDLAIGVAIGSSIQIALFITPLVVILGWIIDQPMTLYFTLFETVCLFVSAFIINFLILDGRSNYLEGALLCATYVIIAIIAFFYPEGKDSNQWSA